MRRTGERSEGRFEGILGDTDPARAPGKRARTDRLPAGGNAPPPSDHAPPAAEEAGEEEEAMWWLDPPGSVDPGTMQSLYYGINPPRHAEKAYQAEDSSPPLHPRPTTVGRSGTIVALATTIYNRPPFGRQARFSICDRSGRTLHSGSLATPGMAEIPGFEPGTEVLIRPETIGTMVKLLTPEQIAGAIDDEQQAQKAKGRGKAQEDDDAAVDFAGGTGNIDPGTMQSLYYGINPPRHAEKAYQPEDGAPPLHPRPTTVGRSGTIVALATTIYNKPPFGKVAQFSVCDRGGKVLHTGAVRTPGSLEITGLEPGTEVLIRPETLGTMVKLLTPEQIAGE
jgi:hypothetical protein